MYEEKFSRVVFPLRTSHYDTKVVLDLLLHKGHFLDICRLAFGPLQASAAGGHRRKDSALHWMDIANFDPSSKQGELILNFLSPGGSLHAIMEHLSVPSSTFHSTLKKQWKDVVDVAHNNNKPRGDSDEDLLSRTFDMPLSALCSFSRQVVTEARDVDLSTLSRDRVPPVMLIPFWHPPMVTREEPLSKQPQNSLPCSMLSYFLLRLLMFVGFRCSNDERRILSDEHRHVAPWRVSLGEWFARVSDDPDRKISRAFPAVMRLMTSYLEFYLKPSQQLHKSISARSLHEIQWDLSTTMSQLLVHAPIGMWLRRLQVHVGHEAARGAIQDPPSLAALTALVPYMAIVVERIVGESSAHLSGGMPSSGVSQTATSAMDICDITKSSFRNALIALRYATQSYPGITNCRPQHYEALFRLWRALVVVPPVTQTTSGVTGYVEAAVLQRYEAYVYTFGDVMWMLANSECISVMTPTCARLLLDILLCYRTEGVARVLRDVSKHVHGIASLQAQGSAAPRQAAGSAAFIEYLKQQLTLTWSRGDGQLVIMDLFNAEMRDLVSKAVMAVWRLCDADMANLIESASTSTGPPKIASMLTAGFHATKSGTQLVSRDVADTLMTVASELLAIVPDARQPAELLKADFLASPRPTQPSALDASLSNAVPGMGRMSGASKAPEGGDVISADERQGYLSGKSAACRGSNLPLNLRFSTHRGQRRIAQHNEPILRSDEFPPMVAFSLVLDDAIELLKTAWHWSRMPRCHRGHLLWLMDDIGVRCNQHHDVPGVWECHTCNITFCSKCKPLPSTTGGGSDDGEEMLSYSAMTPQAAGRAVCDQCHVVFPNTTCIQGYALIARRQSDGVQESKKRLLRYLCAHCASRPFAPVTTRVIAAYSTCWATLLTMIFAGFLYLLWRQR